MSDIRYARWDGSQDPFRAELPTDEIVEQLSEDLLDGWGTDASLRRMLREGMPGRFSGLDELADRIRQIREEQAARGRLPDPLAEVRRRLEDIVSDERLELSADDRPEARFQEIVLDALPDSPAQAIQELRSYDFASSSAAEAFAELLEDLRNQVMEASFRQLADAMRDPSPEAVEQLKDMLADLNRMLDQRQAGTGPSAEEFDEFMRKHGSLFPEQPATLDELLEALAARAAAFSRFMASLSPEQQEELRDLMTSMLDDLDLQFQLDQLGRSLRTLAPGLAWDRPAEAPGDAAGLADALNIIEDLSAVENLERALQQDYPGASLEDIDADELERLLGMDARQDLDRLRSIERTLEEAGVLVRSQGRLELTPRGVRKMGEQALQKVFQHLRVAETGSHEVPVAGGAGEPTGTSRPWQFGDAFRLDLRRTVQNAVMRQGPGDVALHPDDFEILEHETRTAVATVLLLDMSRSMPLRGHWVGAKRMALALHTLISTTFPEDTLEIVAFSDYARPMAPADLAVVDWEPVYGTNMEHAFNLAGRILSRHRDSSKQVLLVTDGEPTAHLEGDQVFFQWPPARETIDRTLREALRLARSGVTMNIFMLEQDPGLAGFIDRLAKIAHGRVFSVRSADLGDMIVRDYLTR